MPTGGKLMGGLLLAATAALAAFVFVFQGISPTPLGWRFVLGNGAVGFVIGWYTPGSRPGASAMGSVFIGIGSLVLLLIAAGVVFSSIFVFGNLERMNFRDPVDLPLLLIETSFSYVVSTLTPQVGATLLAGGMVSGLGAYWAGRRWT
ncbi:MAG: TrgA family protein [Pseudomonadota bacterium]